MLPAYSIFFFYKSSTLYHIYLLIADVAAEWDSPPINKLFSTLLWWGHCVSKLNGVLQTSLFLATFSTSSRGEIAYNPPVNCGSTLESGGGALIRYQKSLSWFLQWGGRMALLSVTLSFNFYAILIFFKVTTAYNVTGLLLLYTMSTIAGFVMSYNNMNICALINCFD